MSTTPPGTADIDWAIKHIQVTNGNIAKVTATVSTTNAQSGNKSRVVLLVNGTKVGDRTEDKAETSISYLIKENGAYEIEALAYNEHADAGQCTITVDKMPVQII